MADAGGTGQLAEWLIQIRLELLTFLGSRTIAADISLLDEALTWVTEHSPASISYLPGWPAIVSQLLIGTGLFIQDTNARLHWLHRNFAEHFAARDMAAGLPSQWPSQNPQTDSLLRDALDGYRSAFMSQVLSAWAKRSDSQPDSLLCVLLHRSDSYELDVKYLRSTLRYGDDTNHPDLDAALSGSLVAEGVPASEALADTIFDRLVTRARSALNARRFCSLIAIQPRRAASLSALSRLAQDEELTLTIRCEAVLALGEAFGLTAAVQAAEPLLKEPGIQGRAISRSLTGVMRLRGGTGSWAVRCAAPVALLLNAISRDIPELPQDGLLFPE